MAATELGHERRACPSQVWQALDDSRLDIDTSSELPVRLEQQGTHGPHARRRGADYLYLEQIAKLVTREAQRPLVFYDIGCGKGRSLCVMARYSFAKVVGVELDPQLCDVARCNARRLRGRVAPIEIVCADPVSLDYSDGHVFFSCDPLGPATLRGVLGSLSRSLARAPRRITVIYYNAVHEGVLDACPWLHCYGLLPTFSGLRVGFWRNRQIAASRSLSA